MQGLFMCGEPAGLYGECYERANINIHSFSRSDISNVRDLATSQEM